MSFHLIETPVLKVTKVRLSSLVLENKAFWGTIFSVSGSDCKAVFPVHPIFHCNWSPKKQSKATLPNKTTSYNHQFNCFLTWKIINRGGHCLHANSTNKLHNSAKTHQTLQQPHPPGIYRGYPKWHDMTWHPARHKPPSIWGRHWALKERDRSRYKTSANLHSRTKHSL